jgi:hypothetical protein
MSRYEGLSGAVPSKGGVYMKPGRFRVKLSAVKDITGQTGVPWTVVEFKILKSDNPEVPVGTERSWVVDMSPSNRMGLPNIKGFLAAVSGVDGGLDDATSRIEGYWSDKTGGVRVSVEEIMEEYVVGANILEGVEMDLECVQIKTKTGGDFTKFNWAVNTQP